jgi:hypothetical protein
MDIYIQSIGVDNYSIFSIVLVCQIKIKHENHFFICINSIHPECPYFVFLGYYGIGYIMQMIED